MIYEAPGRRRRGALLACCSAQLGAVRTTTMKAFPEAAYREIINSLG